MDRSQNGSTYITGFRKPFQIPSNYPAFGKLRRGELSGPPIRAACMRPVKADTRVTVRRRVTPRTLVRVLLAITPSCIQHLFSENKV
jgi:hypothetical protein